ncbi:MAG: alpha/beta hydrolase [Bacteroidetes bacterium]|nr:alpha/beta hydrolase [Bacteroidota bacterium]
MEYTLLIVPGLGNSGVQHWQTYWLKLFSNSQKLIQENWDAPQLENWLEALNKKIATIDGPIVLVAHSLGSILVNQWTKTNFNKKVIAAMLVAPADVDSATHTPPETWNFAPIAQNILPFPTVVVTSENDPYISIERAKFLAEKWGSTFVNVGLKGHLNTVSDLKNWEEGQEILSALIAEIN